MFREDADADVRDGDERAVAVLDFNDNRATSRTGLVGADGFEPPTAGV